MLRTVAICIFNSWKIANPSDYAIRFHERPKRTGFITERVSKKATSFDTFLMSTLPLFFSHY